MERAQVTVQLKSARFRSERESSWLALETILEQIDQRGFASLAAEDVHRLPGLYRVAVSSVSVARAISLDRALLEYLEGLVSRAYIVVYTEKQPFGALLRSFVTERFPRAVYATRRHVLLATALLLLGAGCGFVLTQADPSRYSSFVPASIAQGRTPDASDIALRDMLYSSPDEHSGLALFASYLFTNNAKVGIMCYCLGMLAGIPVVILLFFNGMVLGAMTALYHERGMGGEFLAWIAGHGVTELGAVVICGGAGLRLAQALLFPGQLTRTAALATSGRATAPIIIGAVGMFFVAGLIEGYYRQLVTDPAARWALALLSAGLWCAYFYGVGRRTLRDGN